MTEAVDLVTYAARGCGLVIDYDIAKAAVAATDRTSFEEKERARYEVKIWDGKGPLPDPALDTPERWLHGKDGSSLSAIECVGDLNGEGGKPNGVVYWLFKDGIMNSWQPHRADIPGRIHCVNDPESPNHWEKAGKAHIDNVVQQEVEGQVLKQMLATALEMHQAQGKPYHGTGGSLP